MGEPPCSQVLLTVCRRRSLSSPHQRGNTPYGSEDPSWLPCPPSNRCGSQKQNTTTRSHPSSTENASKRSTERFDALPDNNSLGDFRSENFAGNASEEENAKEEHWQGLMATSLPWRHLE